VAPGLTGRQPRYFGLPDPMTSSRSARSWFICFYDWQSLNSLAAQPYCVDKTAMQMAAILMNMQK
jgi:hypothetical protein